MLKIIKLSNNPLETVVERLYEIHLNNMPKQDQMTRQNFFDEFYVSPNRINLIAQLDDQIIGYIGALDIIDDYNIIGIAVDKTARRKGVGGKLLKALTKIARERNVQTLSLEVDTTNQPAINFYKKNNFEQTSIRKKYYKDNDALIMWHYL
ncbi:MAG: ribosomal protein S18-alanine N-acetyltransferase [Clostridia bacterium]|nr:ribosomal protein S18-alanine N-acetyltransferase [Clostridia bacterium]